MLRKLLDDLAEVGVVVDAEPPPAVLQLGAGEHRVECRWNIGEGKTVHKTVLVREGQTHSVHFRDEDDTDDPS